ncbi:GT2 family glycosyltransferase [Isoptericola sp. CG 20/1183]|uniref:GT2 family glycosyltransferase n=1 Tax=Isoptericola halotolerans TaxID=300560 RepID=A0ABX5EIL3_9MICO|nr:MULTISPECIES: glycosyltransferase [Isoptericola]PRZ02939.1 GT2 family glycosyltransferase [Isoptericola sp. CG 20/1183]PRZ09936.1 GT2 family glycosyltransferase [Isoptericola halotolerans]
MSPTATRTTDRSDADAPDSRVGVVVITHQRRAEVLRTLETLRRLPEQPRVVVVDNGSTDGTAEAIRAQHPWVDLVASAENLGAVGRNVGVDRLDTPYVAFCDDDTWWEPGSLRRAADALDAHPGVAVVTARILVEPGGREDPVVAELRHSPVPTAAGLPGPALGSFLAGASVLRADAFRAAGGFHHRLWLGGEEELLAADLAAAGWELCYLEAMTLHHRPSSARDPHARRRDGIRNTLWFTWLRRPLPAALRRTRDLVRSLPRDRVSAAGVLQALRGLPWVLRERRALPTHAEQRFLALEESQRTSASRRYVS